MIWELIFIGIAAAISTWFLKLLDEANSSPSLPLAGIHVGAGVIGLIGLISRATGATNPMMIWIAAALTLAMVVTGAMMLMKLNKQEPLSMGFVGINAGAGIIAVFLVIYGV